MAKSQKRRQNSKTKKRTAFYGRRMSVVIIIRIIITYVTGNWIALPNCGESSLYLNLRSSMKPSLELRFYEQEGEKWSNKHSTRIFHKVLKKKRANSSLNLSHMRMIFLQDTCTASSASGRSMGVHISVGAPHTGDWICTCSQTSCYHQETWRWDMPLQPQHPHIP